MSMPLINLGNFAAAEGASFAVAGARPAGDGSGDFNKLFLNHIDTALSSESGDLSLDLEAALRAVLAGSSAEVGADPAGGKQRAPLPLGGNRLPPDLVETPDGTTAEITLAALLSGDLARSAMPNPALDPEMNPASGGGLDEGVKRRELGALAGLVVEHRGGAGQARGDSADTLLAEQGVRAETRLRLDAAGGQGDFARPDSRPGQGGEEAARLLMARGDEQPTGARVESNTSNLHPQAASPMALTPANPSGQTSAGMPQLDIQTTVHNPNWGRAMGERIVWLVGQSKQGAEIRLNPPELGPLEVRVAVNQDQQASLVFNTQHSSVRDAIESALPRLREMLADQGLNLVDVDVRQDSGGEHLAAGQHGESGDDQRRASGRDHEAEAGEADLSRVLTSDGLLDTYA